MNENSTAGLLADSPEVAAAQIHARFNLAYPGFRLEVDLRLPGRGVTVLLGSSGSGKTSLLRCIAGLEQAKQGYLQVNGQVWQDTHRGHYLPTYQRALGYVFQEASLFAHLDVRRNLAFGWQRTGRDTRRVALVQAAELLGIEHLLARMPSHLSGGERQRVGIARALLTSPKLLLMDEPLAALDPKRKAEILPYLERLHTELEIPIVYVSHSADEVARLADYLVLLEAGKVLASGPISQMLTRLDLPLALGEDAGAVVCGRVRGFAAAYQLLSLSFPGSQLCVQVAHTPLAIDSPVRFKVQARDVSLALERPAQSSIVNVLPVTIEHFAPADNAAHVLVSLNMQGTTLLARITRYSHEQLALQLGQQVWAQIKSVALLA
jgi:molybdate transport system ATP-binding protein